MSQLTKKSLSLAHDRLNTQLSFLKSDSTEEPDILIQNQKNTSIIIHNRPKQLNAFRLTMFEDILNHLKEFESSKSTDMVLLEGRGRAFGTGVDIKDILKRITGPHRITEFDYHRQIVFNMTYFIGTMKTPLICFIDGLNFGGTCINSALSHFNIATENTKISFPETRFGNFCDAGASFFLSRLNGNIGKYLALTSKTLVAEDVLFSGIATHFVPSNLLATLKEALINLHHPSLSIINQTIETFAVKPGHIATSYTLFGKKRDIVNRCFQFDTVAEIIEALQNEGSEFSLETVDQISQGSPISVALTLENIRRGYNLSLEQCLRIDFRLWQIVPFEDDFRNGILSIVHREKKPQWSRKDCYAVDFEKDILNRYFNIEEKIPLKLITSKNEDRYFTTQGRKFGLPTEEEVKQAKRENNLGSDESIIAWFINQRNDKYGVREEVEEILARERK